MDSREQNRIRAEVREHYGKVGASKVSENCCSTASSCGTTREISIKDISLSLGYSNEDVITAPAGANQGLGCGNPHAIASIKKGETVLDLGSGGGFDCFLAARAVGEGGRVIGVDMTPEMISRSRQNIEKTNFKNIEIRLGEIEYLPVPDAIIDVIISNCVINLSPDKEQVFREAFRVLKPGGRMAVSDVVRTAEIPDSLMQDMELYSQCVTGASEIIELESMLQRVGFEQIRIMPKDESKTIIRDWSPEKNVDDYVVAASIEAVKPT
ncbi:MAG: arsenite methyltransferase [Anaerolineales bacterium]|nr:arsenite methyltransferase [Anaerolineales bacterium]